MTIFSKEKHYLWVCELQGTLYNLKLEQCPIVKTILAIQKQYYFRIAATMRRCHNQTECYAIKGTTCIACQEIKGSSCVGNYCFCGDNRHPTNGKCRDTVNRGK